MNKDLIQEIIILWEEIVSYWENLGVQRSPSAVEFKDYFRLVHTLKGLFAVGKQDELCGHIHQIENCLFKMQLSPENLKRYGREVEKRQKVIGNWLKEMVDRDFKKTQESEEYLSRLVTRLKKDMRELSSIVNKKIRFTFKADYLILQKETSSKLYQFLHHIAKNAVDHAIETPEEREVLGKSLEGNILVSFKVFKGDLLIKFQDDGKGFDLMALRKKAKEQAIVIPLGMTCEEELNYLAFDCDLSSKSSADHLSGRGVGLGAVKAMVKKLGGEILLSSEETIGSTFHFKIPLSDYSQLDIDEDDFEEAS